MFRTGNKKMFKLLVPECRATTATRKGFLLQVDTIKMNSKICWTFEKAVAREAKVGRFCLVQQQQPVISFNLFVKVFVAFVVALSH